MANSHDRNTRFMEAHLRIAHFALGRTNPEAADGIDRTVYHLSRAQAGLGHAVRLFSITNKPVIPIPGVQVSPYRSITPSPLLFTARLRDLLAWRSPLNLPSELINDLLAWNPDFLHLHGVHIPQHLRLARRALRSNIPYCVSVHGMLAGGARARRPWLKRATARLERPFLDRAAFLHALTESEAADLRAYGARSPIAIAPNGIDVGAFPFPAVPSTPGNGAAPDRDRLEFAFLGRLDPDQKGLDMLLEGFRTAGLPHATLTLIGPDWRGSLPALEALARRLGLTPRVTFSGPAFGQRKLDLLGRTTVFVHPSRWEGLAFAVLEAACLGKPCLLTAAADPQGKFEAAGAAVVVGPTSAEIAVGLQRFSRMSPAERDEMGCRARRLVETQFTWPATARTLGEVYKAHSARSRHS